MIVMKFSLLLIALSICTTQLGCRSKDSNAHIHDIFELRFMAFHVSADTADQLIEDLDAVMGLKDWSMRGMGEADVNGEISLIANEGEQTLCLFALEEDLTPEERVAIKVILNKHGATGPFFGESPEDRD